MPEQPISSIIFQTLKIFLIMGVVAGVSILLYNFLGTPFVVLWGLLIVFLGLGYTGVIGWIWAKIRGVK